MTAHAVLFVRDSFCRLFVVKALTSRLVGGGGSFVRRVVFCFFCFGRVGAAFCVESFCLGREGNSYAETCAFGSSYVKILFAGWRGVGGALFG